MRPGAWIFITLAALAGIAVLFFFGLTLQNLVGQSSTTTAPNAPVKQDGPNVSWLDPAVGSASATHVIVEYASYACRYCRSVENDLKRLLATRSDVRLVWKDLPETGDNGSQLAAEAAQCAKSQGKFWEFHDQLFSDSSANSTVQLSLIAQNLGLDTDAFNACLTNRDQRPFVEHSMTEAEALGIDGIPYFFINGQRHSGALSYEQLEAAVR